MQRLRRDGGASEAAGGEAGCKVLLVMRLRSSAEARDWKQAIETQVRELHDVSASRFAHILAHGGRRHSGSRSPASVATDATGDTGDTTPPCSAEEGAEDDGDGGQATTDGDCGSMRRSCASDTELSSTVAVAESQASTEPKVPVFAVAPPGANACGAGNAADGLDAGAGCHESGATPRVEACLGPSSVAEEPLSEAAPTAHGPGDRRAADRAALAAAELAAQLRHQMLLRELHEVAVPGTKTAEPDARPSPPRKAAAGGGACKSPSCLRVRPRSRLHLPVHLAVRTCLSPARGEKSPARRITTPRPMQAAWVALPSSPCKHAGIAEATQPAAGGATSPTTPQAREIVDVTFDQLLHLKTDSGDTIGGDGHRSARAQPDPASAGVPTAASTVASVSAAMPEAQASGTDSEREKAVDSRFCDVATQVTPLSRNARAGAAAARSAARDGSYGDGASDDATCDRPHAHGVEAAHLRRSTDGAVPIQQRMDWLYRAVVACEVSRLERERARPRLEHGSAAMAHASAADEAAAPTAQHPLRELDGRTDAELDLTLGSAPLSPTMPWSAGSDWFYTRVRVPGPTRRSLQPPGAAAGAGVAWLRSGVEGGPHDNSHRRRHHSATAAVDGVRGAFARARAQQAHDAARTARRASASAASAVSATAALRTAEERAWAARVAALEAGEAEVSARLRALGLNGAAVASIDVRDWEL